VRLAPDNDPPAPITFIRPDPSQFVLLVAKTRGNGIVAGTENFKPGGTEWATDRDLRDAGYMPVEDGRKLLELLREAVSAAEQADDRFETIGTGWMDRAERILGGGLEASKTR
jgi:hypothetical protein